MTSQIEIEIFITQALPNCMKNCLFVCKLDA